ncbi:MAG: formate dehydrogenase subunit delta [Acidimicrobiales bacterium]
MEAGKQAELIRMANQIAGNFAHHPVEQAATEVASHLRSFWTPSMLRDLTALAAGGSGSDGSEPLDPVVIAAVRLLG